MNTADGMPTVSDLPIEILALPAVLAVVNPPAKNCGHMPSRKAGSTTKQPALQSLTYPLRKLWTMVR